MPAKRTYSTPNGLRNTPPDYMGRQAKVTWRKMVTALGKVKAIKESDSDLIELYATNYEIYREAYKHLQEKGSVRESWEPVINPITGKTEGEVFRGYKRNPSTAIMNDAVKQLTKIGSELGLSPKGRRELLKNIDNDDDGESVTADIMKLFKDA